MSKTDMSKRQTFYSLTITDDQSILLIHLLVHSKNNPTFPPEQRDAFGAIQKALEQTEPQQI